MLARVADEHDALPMLLSEGESLSALSVALKPGLIYDDDRVCKRRLGCVREIIGYGRSVLEAFSLKGLHS